MDYPRIAALATHIGPQRNEFGAAVEPDLDEIGMAILVARKAMACLAPEISIDAVVFANCGVPQVFPSGAAAVVEALGLFCPGLDVGAGCASMSLAVEVAANRKGNVLVVCSDKLSGIVNPNDPTHFPLRSFGDGAAAVVISHDPGPGHRILGFSGKTMGRWRRFYQSSNGMLIRSLPPEEKKELSEAYVKSWTTLCRDLMALCPPGMVPTIFANQGDPKLFPLLLKELDLPPATLIQTNHGHAGGADPWVGLQAHTPPTGSMAICLASGIGFTFHSILLRIES